MRIAQLEFPTHVCTRTGASMAAAVLIYECAIASVVLQGAAGAVKRRATFSAQLEAQRDSVCFRLRAAEHAPISEKFDSGTDESDWWVCSSGPSEDLPDAMT